MPHVVQVFTGTNLERVGLVRMVLTRPLLGRLVSQLVWRVLRRIRGVGVIVNVLRTAFVIVVLKGQVKDRVWHVVPASTRLLIMHRHFILKRLTTALIVVPIRTPVQYLRLPQVLVFHVR